MRSARAARPWAPAWWSRSRSKAGPRNAHSCAMDARKRAYGGKPACPGSAPSRGRAGLVPAFAPARLVRGASLVLRLAMVLPFMHLQPCGGPRGRRKRFRRSVAQWLEHRSPNSASAIPPRSIAWHLVNVFGPNTHSSPRRHTAPFCPVPSNWVAKW